MSTDTATASGAPEWVTGILPTLIPTGSGNHVGPALRVGVIDDQAAVILAPASYTGLDIAGIDALLAGLTEARRRLALALPDADAPRTAAGDLRHTCNGDDPRGLGFGRRDIEHCARCRELEAGAPARADHAAGRRRAQHQGYPTDAERAAHRATCTTCLSGFGVCTFGDW